MLEDKAERLKAQKGVLSPYATFREDSCPFLLAYT